MESEFYFIGVYLFLTWENLWYVRTLMGLNNRKGTSMMQEIEGRIIVRAMSFHRLAGTRTSTQ